MQGSDTLVCLKRPQLTVLNRQISLLSAFKITCEETVQRADSIMADYKRNQTTLREIILNKDLELQNNQTEIGNLQLIAKKQRKKWVKNVLYCSGGSVVVGLLAGILISK